MPASGSDTTDMRHAIVLALSLGLAGCCDIVRGRTQTFPLRLDPHSATVTVTAHNSRDGFTIAPNALDRRGIYAVDVVVDGYAPADALVERHQGGVWWILLWVHPALIGAGMIVNSATGAEYHLKPECIDVKLTPVAAAGASTASTLKTP